MEILPPQKGHMEEGKGEGKRQTPCVCVAGGGRLGGSEQKE